MPFSSGAPEHLGGQVQAERQSAGADCSRSGQEACAAAEDQDRVAGGEFRVLHKAPAGLPQQPDADLAVGRRGTVEQLSQAPFGRAKHGLESPGLVRPYRGQVQRVALGPVGYRGHQYEAVDSVGRQLGACLEPLVPARDGAAFGLQQGCGVGHVGRELDEMPLYRSNSSAGMTKQMCVTVCSWARAGM